MFDEEVLVVEHTTDKENFETFLADYLDDDSVSLTDKQWTVIARNIDERVSDFYESVLYGMCEDFDETELSYRTVVSGL